MTRRGCVKMSTFKVVMRFRGGSWGTILIDRTILVQAENTGHALEQAEQYITERSNHPALRINVSPAHWRIDNDTASAFQRPDRNCQDRY